MDVKTPGRKTLAAPLLAGGAVGFVLQIWNVLDGGGQHLVRHPVGVLLAVVLNAGCVAAGWALWRGWRSGYLAAAIAWTIQLPAVVLGGLGYAFWAAPSAGVGVNGAGLGSWWALAPDVRVHGGYLPEHWAVGLNLVALAGLVATAMLATRVARPLRHR